MNALRHGGAPQRAFGPSRTAPLAILAGLALLACERHEIPPHATYTPPAKNDAAAMRYVKGGKRVFFDDFQRAELGDKWQIDRLPKETAPATWKIVDGWVANDDARNQGLWAQILPAGEYVRVEFAAKSERLANGGAFPGDLKCEAFGTAPHHESGYSFINGGWGNTLDTVAKLGEHTADDARVPAKALEPGKVYRYAAVRAGKDFYWFRDGELLYTFHDETPVGGAWFAFNNWLSNARFDEVAVYELTP